MQAIGATLTGNAVDPVVLVVDDEPDMQDLFRDIVAAGVRCRVHVAGTIAEARSVLAKHPVQLMVADVMLPDGNGLDLLEELNLTSPHAGAVFMTSKPAVDQTVFALRHGALDFLAKPFNARQIQERVSSALHRQAIIVRDERRLTRLKSAVRELNKARHTVSQKVDILCNDLINAYGEISGQFQEVRLTERFRKTINQARDLEQLLCHAMDWLLKEAGYSNIGIWLSGDDQVFELGAYMKYTVVGDKSVTNALHTALIQPTVREGLLHMSEAEFAHRLSPADRKLLPKQTVMSASCTYLGESLAVVALFRDSKSPFRDEDVSMLKNVASVFATALATMVHGPADDDAADNDAGKYVGDDAGDEDAGHDGAPDLLEEPEQTDQLDSPEQPKQKKRKKRKDEPDADWWKRGEPPPF
ncbi:MAG: response regulator [Burkholderiales bacterium]|nr:response regulator [Phycisphaerae bacterium]